MERAFAPISGNKSDTTGRDRMEFRELDPSNWTLPSKEDVVSYIEQLTNRASDSHAQSSGSGRKVSIDLTLDVHSVSLYCYLKIRFGVPNGLTMMMGHGGTDDLYHWHYTLRSGEAFLDIHSTQMGLELTCFNVAHSPEREEFLKEKLLADIENHRRDIGREKQRLEDWTVFVNPYHRLDDVIGGLEARVSDFNLVLPKLKPMTASGGHWEQDDLRAFEAEATAYGRQLADAQTVGLSIKTVVPIWIESFINLVIFLLAKDNIKNDKRAFDSCFRQQVDVRVKMLPNFCNGFAEEICNSDPEFKSMHKLFQTRNELLHGTIDVKKLQVDRMYFDGMVPLYEEWKSDYERRIAPAITFIEPSEARQDIVIGSEFIIYLVSKLERKIAEELWAVSSSSVLGYRKDKRRVGILFGKDIHFFVPAKVSESASRPRSLEECEPRPDSQCPCGSGVIFGACCQGHYKQSDEERVRGLLREGRFRRALVEARRHLCWYSLCHQAHTEPQIASAAKEAQSLLELDISAQ